MSRRWRILSAFLFTALLVAGTAVVIDGRISGEKSITAYFRNATSIYPGDSVRVSGVKVGTVTAIVPDGDRARLELEVARDVPIPADASAVLVSQSLIAARYVQLTPAYEHTGPTMGDGAVIPLERTAVPVEWDEVKDQLTRLAEELGERTDNGATPLARFIDSAATAMGDGNGDKLRQAIGQLSGVGRVLAGGGDDLVGTIANLQTFVTALRDSNTQIVEFQGRLATLSSVLEGTRSDLDAALTNVSEVIDDVRRFIVGTRDVTAEQLERLTNVTTNLVERKRDIEQILHVAPSGVANTYNFFDPRDGAINGVFGFNNFSNPLALLCGSIGAIENVTAAESSKLCSQYLGPAFNTLNFNGLPFPVNPLLTSVPTGELLKYTDPRLMPGGVGTPSTPPAPPAVSAYTGSNGDVPAPPGYGPPPGPAPPDTLEGMLLPDGPLPAEAPLPEGTPTP